MRSTLKYHFTIFLVLFGLLYIFGILNKVLEGFENPFGNIPNPFGNMQFSFGKTPAPIGKSSNPFEEFMKKIQEIQETTSAFDKWVGYVYKHAPENSNILNDFKSRVFQPNCRFRKLWATQLPKGMNIPNSAENATSANIAYKTYMNCLSEGNGTCMGQLENARTRFMEPGCQFLSPKDPKSYSRDYRVSIH